MFSLLSLYLQARRPVYITLAAAPVAREDTVELRLAA
jgi:hypothetical protein